MRGESIKSTANGFESFESPGVFPYSDDFPLSMVGARIVAMTARGGSYTNGLLQAKLFDECGGSIYEEDIFPIGICLGYASSLALSPGSYSKMEDTPETLHPGEWFCCPDYLYGVDLYNLVYHWEAHGILEGLWKGLSAVMSSEYIFRG